MIYPTTTPSCAPALVSVEICIQLPGGAQICSFDTTGTGDPFPQVQQLFGTLNAALAPLTPIFNIIATLEAVVTCVQAATKLPNPVPLVESIVMLEQAIAKLLTLVPQLSVPIMLVQTIKALAAALLALVTRLQAIVAKEAAIAASALKAKNIPALQLVVNCAQKNLALEMLNLNAAFAPGTSPIGQLLGLVNGLASLVPGLPNPLIPNLSMLGPDASAAIQPLVTMAATLEALASSIPTP